VLFSNRVRVRIRVRIIFIVWFVCGYAHAFVPFSVVNCQTSKDPWTNWKSIKGSTDY